jgi:hypothetical protein
MSKCTKCGSKAYVGARSVECSNEECDHYSASFARSCKDTDPAIPSFNEEVVLDDSDEGPVIYLPNGPTGSDSTASTESDDELEIDWGYWDDLGAYYED